MVVYCENCMKRVYAVSEEKHVIHVVTTELETVKAWLALLYCDVSVIAVTCSRTKPRVVVGPKERSRPVPRYRHGTLLDRPTDVTKTLGAVTRCDSRF